MIGYDQNRMQFLLLIYTDETAWARYSRAEQQSILAGHATFRAEAEAAGKFVSEQMLQPTTNSVRVRRREGKYRRKNGPFRDNPEQLGGYYVLECDDIDEAVRWSAKLPEVRSGSIIVRELVAGLI